MFKNKIKIILLLLVIVFLVFLKYKWDDYKSKKQIYNYHIGFVFEDIVLKLSQNQIPLTKNNFDIQVKKQPFFSGYKGLLDKLNYSILYKKDSIYIYEFGFDNTDNKLANQYLSKDVSFFKSFFIKGDLLIYKNNKELFSNSKKDVKYFDAIMPTPPIPIPQKTLDSISGMDSIKRIEFINNYGKK